jgi:hypothetical protein
MLYVICGLLCLTLLAAALFFFFRSGELSVQLRASEEAWKTKEESYVSELAKLEKIRHIPDIIEKSKKVNAHVEGRLADAEKRAGEIFNMGVCQTHVLWNPQRQQTWDGGAQRSPGTSYLEPATARRVGVPNPPVSGTHQFNSGRQLVGVSNSPSAWASITSSVAGTV